MTLVAVTSRSIKNIPSTPKHGLMKSHRLIARTLAGVLFSTALAPAADDVSKFQQPGSVVTTATSQPGSKGLAPGKFGNAINLASDNGEVSIPIPGVLKDRPVTFACWVKLNSLTAYNIIMSVGPKSGKHWEVFTTPGGRLTVFIPDAGNGDLDAANFPTQAQLEAGQWHHLAFRIGQKSLELYLDGKNVLEKTLDQDLAFDEHPLLLGAIMGDGSMRCDGAVDDLVISRGTDALVVPTAPAQATASAIAIFPFDEVDKNNVSPNKVSASAIQAGVKDPLRMPSGNRFLDEVEEDERNASTLHGDAAVEAESVLPVRTVVAEASDTTIAAAEPLSISLNGEWLLKEGKAREKNTWECKEGQGITAGWFKENADRSSWRRVQVPTSVQSALLKLGETPDPLYDANTWNELQKNGYPQDVPWQRRHTRIEMNEWWFARQFELPKDWDGQRIRLAFDGIDYAGSVFLNGRLLGYHAGMFGGPEFDISKAVRFGQPNTLVVRLDRSPDDWFGILKGSPGWGWHYGHLISLGIWRGVKVEQVPEVKISDVFVRTKSLEKDKAVVLVQYDIVNSATEASSVQVGGTIAGKGSAPANLVNRVSAPNGRSRWQTEVTVAQPKLWWPMNYGEQNLYELRLQTGGAAGSFAASTFGIRTIEMRPMCGTKAEQDYRWQFVINGVPMFIKGANWCWSDPMLQCDPAKYEHLLELARRAGIQMFRAWGGGIIETDEFYRLCDEKGLMVYQEFPFCWGPPTFPMTDGAVLDQQVSRVVKRLRNHPSLIMWGGGNENPANPGADEGLFLVGRRCRQFDPTRPFHRTSPWGGSIHNWKVFHHGAPIDDGFMSNPSAFLAEFGSPSMNSREEFLKFLPAEKLEVWPPKQDDGGLISHMCQFGYGDLAKVMRYADYAPIRSWKDYIEFSQMAQGDLIAFATNLQRAGSYVNKAGLWFYKFTDLFPGHSWAVVGFYGQPKLSYYRAKQFFAPQAAFAQAEKYDWSPEEPFRASLNVSNDSSKPLENAVAKAVIYGSDLTEVWSKEYKVPALGTSTRAELEPIKTALPKDTCKPFLLAVSLRDSSGRQLSDQWMWFNFRAKTDAVKELEKIPAWGYPHDRVPEAFKVYAELPEARLLNLPKTQLAASVKRDGQRGTITVRNESKLPAFNVIIEGFPLNYGNFLGDNSFSLYPNEERTIAFDLASADTPLGDLRVRAWNAESVPIKSATK
jgi:beta-mannosidase